MKKNVLLVVGLAFISLSAFNQQKNQSISLSDDSIVSSQTNPKLPPSVNGVKTLTYGEDDTQMKCDDAGGKISFEVAGSEKMNINNNGNVGIGTTSPTSTLNIVGNSYSSAPSIEGTQIFGGGIELTRSTNSPYIDFNANTLSQDYDSRLILYGGSTSQMFSILGAPVGINYTTYNSNYRLSVGGNSYFSGNAYVTGNLGLGTTSPSKKLHVVGDSYFNGNVGIGTSTPTTKLEVYGNGTFTDDGTNSITIGTHSTGFPMIQADGDIHLNPNGGDVIIGSSYPGDLYLKHSASLSENDGSVNIGSATGTSPSEDPLLNVRLRINETMPKIAAIFSSYDQQGNLFIVPKLTAGLYNALSIEGDQGIFWNDGLATGSNNLNAGLVIAPKGSSSVGIRITSDGNVGIGTPLSTSGTTNRNPNGYKLAVNGTIGAKEVVVETTSTTWPDYVFSNNYNLMNLNEVEEYLKQNNHLPGIPSAYEVSKNGIAIGEMNKALLKKVEELTLYIIQLQKEVNELKKNN